MIRHERPGHANRRRAITLAALAPGVLALASCSGGSEEASGEAGTLRVSFFRDDSLFPCVDPFQSNWVESRTIINGFSDSLTDQDPDTGEIVPHLATSWDVSKDGLTYTFTLRDDVTFSDGSELDADAVKANVDGWLATIEENPAAGGTSYIVGLDGATVVDPYTIEFNLSAPNSSLLQATSTTNLAIVAPAAFDQSAAERCAGDQLVGTGPFILDHYTPSTGAALTKRDGYSWPSELEENQGEAHLDRVEFTYIQEDSVRVGNLLGGATDVVWQRNAFTVQDRSQIEDAGHTIEQRSLPGLAFTHFANVSDGRPLADPAVRKALLKAVDVQTFAATVFGPEYPVVEGVFGSTMPHFKSQATKLVHDPDGARQLLDDAGWVLGDDGFRSKDGQRLSILYPVEALSVGAELLQAQLQEVGIEVQLNPITPAELPTYRAEGDYDLVITPWVTRADPGSLLTVLVPDLARIREVAERAASDEQRVRISELIDRARSSNDEATISAAYGELQDYLIDEALAFPLFERVQQAGIATGVDGVAFDGDSLLRLNSVSKS